MIMQHLNFKTTLKSWQGEAVVKPIQCVFLLSLKLQLLMNLFPFRHSILSDYRLKHCLFICVFLSLMVNIGRNRS